MRWYYEQNLALANVFFDWRHKLLTLGIGAASALVAISASLRSGNDVLDATPALLGCLISISVALVNERHARILRATYQVGVELERALAQYLRLDSLGYGSNGAVGPMAVLSGVASEPHRRAVLPSFTFVIRWLTFVVAATCAVAAAMTLGA